MNKTLKIVLIVLVSIAVATPIVISVFIHEVGRNYVHDQPSTPEYYEHIQNRISFSATSRGDLFDSQLITWLQQNPPYGHYDSVGTVNFRYDSCHCDCFPFKRLIYFPDSPKEIYLITYEYGEIRSGIIDIVYQYRNDGWSCRKTSQIDSAEKIRIKSRMEYEIVKKLNL
jgi:hypothetical protein